ncbi:hypothetical protein F7D01_00485 [Erythrobacter sp. 3-20A1M]|uniref:hypothetical protein n=1 Tax=Erythrobacter sp. 3-20A1M TaxID=2653850 RepID=UPI001BFC53E8|nr:hypothetical protein [Erythrobacter sp. 3-20A1M]QWC55761.1 hypothetical protein F7D01_00485 [Erythrobacter sp. 3-20A1M]
MRDEPTVTASFYPVDSGDYWPAHVALAINFGETGRTYWWLPASGGSNNLQYIVSTTDVTLPEWHPPSPDGGERPLGEIEYIGTDADYNIIDDIPTMGGIAPAHMLLTSLGDRTWHWSTTQRDSAPKQFFDLIGCASDN